MSASLPTPELRLGRAADLHRVAMMSRTLIEAGLGWRWRPERLAAQLQDPDSLLLVAVTEVSLVGFSLMSFGRDEAHLLLLAVSPPFQRRGLAGRLLGWMEKSARTAGIRRVQLEVRLDNYPAQAFYRSRGYRSERLLPGYYRNRECALRMVRELRAPVA